MWRSVSLFFFAALGCSSPSPAANVCQDGDETRQRFGTNCTCCHAEFGLAGSVRDHVSRVEVDDSAGLHAVVSPNGFGNFFRHVQPVPPLRARVVMDDGSVREMASAAPHGACNECHRPSGVPGPL